MGKNCVTSGTPIWTRAAICRRAARWKRFWCRADSAFAPVTMDAWDWNFAGVYDDAKKRDDKALQQEVVSNYLSYHTAVVDYFEKLSKDLLGYEPRQILLLHANNLEADHIRELIELLRKRGYRF